MIKKLTLLILLFKCLAFANVSAQINTDRMLAIGYNAMVKENYILAIQHFNKVIKSKPYLYEGFYLRGYCKFRLEDNIGAYRDFQKALELNPFSTDVYNMMGIVTSTIERDDEKSIDYFTKGLEISFKDYRLLINRGDSFRKLNEYDKAIEDYNKALKIDPKLISVYLNRSLAKVNKGDSLGAIEDLNLVEKRSPRLVDIYWMRGIIYSQLGHLDSALIDYSKAIRLKENISDFYINRGVVYYQLDSLKNAMQDYDKALELNPRNTLALTNRGLLRAYIGDKNKAIEDFSRLLALNPNDQLTLYNRALLYQDIGNDKLAINDLNIIIENNPGFAAAYQSRGISKYNSGDKNGARLDFTTADKLYRDNIEDKPRKNNSTKSDKANDKKKKGTRKSTDKDLKNYDKLAVLNDFDDYHSSAQDEVSIRGKVQNRNIFIDLEPVFGLTYYSGDTLLHLPSYYQKEVVAYNKKELFKKPLTITNRETEVEGLTYIRLTNDINNITQELQDEETDRDILIARGALYSMVMNYSNAMADYNEILKSDPKNVVALFSRAYARHKMVEVIESLEEETQAPNNVMLQGPIKAKGHLPTQKPQKEASHILDYELIIKDLNKVIELAPDFEFAYYNRAIVHCLKKNFLQGVEDFTRAIELNADFAEAYFNRGLTLIYLEQEAKGTADLSKAGELGIYKAYNVIKRYGAEELSGKEKIAEVE